MLRKKLRFFCRHSVEQITATHASKFPANFYHCSVKEPSWPHMAPPYIFHAIHLLRGVSPKLLLVSSMIEWLILVPEKPLFICNQIHAVAPFARRAWQQRCIFRKRLLLLLVSMIGSQWRTLLWNRREKGILNAHGK